MKTVRKIAEIQDPGWARAARAWSPRTRRERFRDWVETGALTAAQQRLLKRYPDSWVARGHPQKQTVEIYIDPAVVADSDWTIINLVFER